MSPEMGPPPATTWEWPGRPFVAREIDEAEGGRGDPAIGASIHDALPS
jgi:hypothetical protein